MDVEDATGRVEVIMIVLRILMKAGTKGQMGGEIDGG